MPVKLKWPELNERRASIISALMIAVGPLSLALYTPAMPTMAHAFGVDNGAIKLTLTLYFFGFCVAQLICGPLSDAFGRRPVALWFFALYLIGSAVALAAPDVVTLQAARAAQGVGAAAGVAISRALVRDLFVGQTSARIMNRIGLLVGLVPALSPTIGGLVLLFGHWRMLFAIMLVYAIVLLAAMIYFLPETNRNRDPHLIEPAIVTRNYLTLLSDRRFLAPALLMCAVLGGLYTIPSLMPFVLIGKLGLTPLEYGLAMLLQTMALMAGNLVAGRMMRRISARRLIPLGVLLVGLGGLAFAAIRFAPMTGLPIALALPVLMGPVALWIFGLPFITAGAMTLALAPFPRMAGAASAMVGFLQMGGGFVGSAIAAAAFADPIVATHDLMPAIAACVVIAYFALPRAQLGPSDLSGD